MRTNRDRALWVAGAVLGFETSAAAAPPARRVSTLFEREPLGFDTTTLHRVVSGLGSLPERLPDFVHAHAADLLVAGAALALVSLVAIGWALIGGRRVTPRIERAFDPLRAKLPPHAAASLAALVRILAVALVPLGLLGLDALAAELTGVDDPAFQLVGILVGAWARLVIAAAAVRELVLRPLLPVPAEHGRYLYGAGRWIFAYAILCSAVIAAAGAFGAPDDAIALATALFELALIVFVGAFLARRRAVMSLFPDVPNRLYRGFLATLDRVYFLALAVTLATALLAWAGYVRLAHFVWVRTWAIAALFVGAVFVHHALRVGLRGSIPQQFPPHEHAESFYRSSARLLDYVVVVAVAIVALDLAGVRAPLTQLLATPFSTVAEHPLSLLTIVQALAIVAAFIFAARLLRDYLEYRVYPALGIDEGVAHAIDTSLIYSVSIIGVLAALQAVGLGLGSLTVFAGALGIGVGFGLQSLAGNLASGLVLIFSRALRKGDWVKVGDTVGVIQEVGIRATRLRTEDAVEYLVPNSDFVAGTIVNWTHSSPYVRVHVRIGVAYKSDPEQVKQILESVAVVSPHVERTPRPQVRLVKFADSSIDFELLVWIHRKQVSEDEVASDLYFAIFRAFAEAGVEIPFPQREIHVRSG
jgi:small-conductance mechanosensitive channel